MELLSKIVLFISLLALGANGKQNRGIFSFGGGHSSGGYGRPGSSCGGYQGGFGSFGGSRPSNCRYWCKTPEGQAYCCENFNQNQLSIYSTNVVKPGQCPPVRPVCPLRSFSGPPRTCSSDGACNGRDKCCFDRCLGEHVCKPPSGYGK